MNSGTLNAKSFTSFSINQALLAKCVEAVKEGDKLAKQSGTIQSFEVFRQGFRMNLVIGQIFVIPPSVCSSKSDFPVSLLYGALVKEIRPEDLSDLMSAKIGDSEFDEYDEADLQEIKEKLFKVPGMKKYTSLVCFQPSWTSPREYVFFKYTKDDAALGNALRHLVFAAYYDPQLSSAFNAVVEDTDTTDHGSELDVTNITPKLPFPGVAEGILHAYPNLESGNDTESSQDRATGPGSKKKKKASASKRKIVLAADAAKSIHDDMLAAGEVDVISAVTEAAEAAVLNGRETVYDAAMDDNAAKHASSKVGLNYKHGPKPGRDVKDTKGHTERLRRTYDNDFEQFKAYDEIYGLSSRLGFATSEEAWEANPMVYGSVYPEDLHVVSSVEDDNAAKHASSKTAACQHQPHNSDSMQTVCERCGMEMYYNSATDTWTTSKKAKCASQVPCPHCRHTEASPEELEDHIEKSHKKKAGAIPGCDCTRCEKCGVDNMVCAKCGQCARCSEPGMEHAEGCEGCSAGLPATCESCGEEAGTDEQGKKYCTNRECQQYAENMDFGKTVASKTAAVFCECVEPSCPYHDQDKCYAPMTEMMFHTDASDMKGTPMCEACAENALNSGVFTTKGFEESEDELPQVAFDGKVSSKKKADTSANPANEKGGEGAIKVNLDTDVKNTRGTEPTLAPDKNAAAKQRQFESKNFDTSTIEGLEACERYQNRLYNTYNSVEVKTIGLDRVVVVGKNPIGNNTASVTAGGHKPGCTCGFCKNKGSFGKKKDDGDDKDEEKTEKEASSKKIDMRIQKRIQELEAIIRPELISIENGARPQLDDYEKVIQDPATCGNCGMTWNDALITGRTPAPSGRCPYESIHKEIAELNRLRQRAKTEKEASLKTAMIFRELDPAEEKQFREWARQNDPPDMKSWDLYHPACRQEWEMRGIKPHDNKQLGLGVPDVDGLLDGPERTNASSEEFVSDRVRQAKLANESRLEKLRKRRTADESDDIIADISKAFGKPAEVKVKDGDGRSDGATPKLADAGSAADWFTSDRGADGQPKSQESLEIPESEPVTGIYNLDAEGKDPVGKALNNAPATIVAPVSLSEGQKPTDVEDPIDLADAATALFGEEPDTETHEEPSQESHDEPTEESSEEEKPEPKTASMTMKCPQCKKQATKESHDDPYTCQCGWKSKLASSRRKFASDRVIATLDDLLLAEPFDPDNEDHPDSSLMKGLTSGPIPGGTHETNDTAGPANKVADMQVPVEAPISSEGVVEEAPCVDCGGSIEGDMSVPFNFAEPEPITNGIIDPLGSGDATEVIEAPEGSGKVVININASKWLQAHGMGRPNPYDTLEVITGLDGRGLDMEDPDLLLEAIIDQGVEVPFRDTRDWLALINHINGAGFIITDESLLRQSLDLELETKEAGNDYQVEPVTSGIGATGAVGRDGMPDLAKKGSAKTADALSQHQMDFFTGPVADAVKSVAPGGGNIPTGGGAEGGEEGGGASSLIEEAAPLAAVAAAKTAERVLPQMTTPSSNYQGWHNWDTWHTKLLIDNTEQTYNTQRNLVNRALKEARGGEVNIEKLAHQFSKLFAAQAQETLSYAKESWPKEQDGEINWREIAQNAVQHEMDEQEASKAVPPVEPKQSSTEKEATFSFYFPGQALKEFYPELQHEVVDSPNANNSPMIEDIDLESSKVGFILEKPVVDWCPSCYGENPEGCKHCGGSGIDPSGHMVHEDNRTIEQRQKEEQSGGKRAGNYVPTNPGAVGIGNDGKPQVLDGAPLRKEQLIRGPQFQDEFYQNYPGVPGKYMAMASNFKKRAAASADQKEMLGDFLKRVMGEVAVSFVSAFKVTGRPLELNKVPGTGELNIMAIEDAGSSTVIGNNQVGGRIKFLLEKMSDSEIRDAINGSWAQASVWHSGSGSGNYTFECFVRCSEIDIDSMTLKYEFVCGTKGE